MTSTADLPDCPAWCVDPHDDVRATFTRTGDRTCSRFADVLDGGTLRAYETFRPDGTSDPVEVVSVMDGARGAVAVS